MSWIDPSHLEIFQRREGGQPLAMWAESRAMCQDNVGAFVLHHALEGMCLLRPVGREGGRSGKTAVGGSHSPRRASRIRNGSSVGSSVGASVGSSFIGSSRKVLISVEDQPVRENEHLSKAGYNPMLNAALAGLFVC